MDWIPNVASAFIDIYTNEKSSNVIVELAPEKPGSFVYPISKEYDEVLYYWIEVVLPPNRKWVERLGHNLFKKITLADFSWLQSFTPRTLDFIANFEVAPHKKEEYYKYIDGNRVTTVCIPLPFVKHLPTGGRLKNWTHDLKISLTFNDKPLVVDGMDPVATDFKVKVMTIGKVIGKRDSHSDWAEKTITFPVHEEYEALTAVDLRSVLSIDRIYFGLYDWVNHVFIDNVRQSLLSYEQSGRFHCPSHQTSFIFPYFESECSTDPTMHMVSYGDVPTDYSKLTNVSLYIIQKIKPVHEQRERIVAVVRGVKSYTFRNPPITPAVPQPVPQPVPVAEPGPQPVADPVPQPVADPVPQPVADPVPQQQDSHDLPDYFCTVM
jgi:hypothetical protein